MTNYLFFGLVGLTITMLSIGIYGVKSKVIPFIGLLTIPFIALMSYYFFTYMW